MAHLKQRPMWNDLFEPLHSLNFGVSGDTTQNVLWRIKNGALDNIKPKVNYQMQLTMVDYYVCLLGLDTKGIPILLCIGG